MRAVWQIAQENIPDLVAVNLSNNKIRVLDDSSSVEIKKLKDLKIVHLGNNNVSKFYVNYYFFLKNLWKLTDL